MSTRNIAAGAGATQVKAAEWQPIRIHPQAFGPEWDMLKKDGNLLTIPGQLFP
jgi:hypothetical protein